jgi:hypothetical protein
VRWAITALVLTACGRIGFGTTSGTGDDGAGGGGGGDSGSGSGSGGSGSGVPIDAAITACTNAVNVPVGVRTPSSTCAGGDKVDSCGPAGTQEVVFKVTPASTAGYTIRAYDGATNNTTNSTQQMNAACQPTGGCTGVFGMTLNAATTYYFVVEASAGGCANVEFSVM